MKKICFALFLVFISLSLTPALAASNLEEGVGQLAERISKSMQEKQKQKIAIIDFSDLNGNVTALGQFMAEELTTQLFMVAPGKFEVVERRQIMKLADELMLGQSGFVEEKSIKKMGQVLGVDAIVTGSMTDLGNTVKINARLIGVESAKVFAVAATDIPKTGMVADLIGKQVEKIEAVTQHKQTTSTTGMSRKQEVKNQGTERVFQNNRLKITIQSLKKSGNTVTAPICFENIDQKPFSVWLWDGGIVTYLLDESGNRWNFKSDTAEVSRNTRGVELIPGTKLLSKFTFEATGGAEGTLFTLVSKFDSTTEQRSYGNPINITINDIPAE